MGEAQEWLRVRKNGLHFEALGNGDGWLRWRIRHLTGWRRFLPVRWTRGLRDDMLAAHWLFVTGKPRPASTSTQHRSEG